MVSISSSVPFSRLSSNFETNFGWRSSRPVLPKAESACAHLSWLVVLSLDYHVGDCIVEETESCIRVDPQAWNGERSSHRRIGCRIAWRYPLHDDETGRIAGPTW